MEKTFGSLSFSYKFLVCVCSACVVFVAGCGRRHESERPDVALVTIDGNFTAKEMTSVFETALESVPSRSPSPFTLPAAASALTGLMPSEHGLHIDGVGSLDPKTPTLATKHAADGYECGAFISSFALAPIHGLTNGFAVYDLKLVSNSQQSRRTRNSKEVVDAAAAWLDKTQPSKKPRFIWVHLPRETGTLEEVSRLFSHLSKNQLVKIIPLFGNGENRMFSLDDSVVLVNAAQSAGQPTLSVPSVENFMPWYVLRMPPLMSPRNDKVKITLPKRTEQATLAEYSFLRANGHLGEGLISAYEGVAESALSPEDADFAARALAALALNGTNAFAAVSALAEERPDIPVLHSRLGDILYSEQKYIEAFGEYSKATANGVNMIHSTRRMSQSHIAIGNIAPAIDQAENAFLMNPADPSLRRELAALLLNVGSALIAQKQHTSAVDFLGRVLWLEPKNPDGLFVMAQLQLGLGETNSAAAYLKEIQALRPEDKRAAAALKAIGK